MLLFKCMLLDIVVGGLIEGVLVTFCELYWDGYYFIASCFYFRGASGLGHTIQLKGFARAWILRNNCMQEMKIEVSVIP